MNNKHLELTEEEISEMVQTITTARYDSVVKFFVALGKQFVVDSTKDEERGRPMLSNYLSTTATYLCKCVISMASAWSICKNKMDEQK